MIFLSALPHLPDTRLRPQQSSNGPTKRFRFTYRLQNGHLLTGTFKGECRPEQPHVMLHLHDWQVTYCQPEGRPLLTFDAGFGQIELMPVRPLITGTHSATGALFGVNYRTAEVSIYNAITQQWLTESWSPSAWQIVPCTEEIQPVLAIASRWPWLPTHEPHGENTWIERPSALLSYS